MHNKENTKEADGIFERILGETEQQGKKYAELIEFLDLPRGTFSAWKAGRSRNFCEHICAISEFLNVDVGWLASGNRAESPVNVKETELLEAFRKLSQEKQDAVLQNVKWLAE